jgi:diaminopimelate epimerase
MQFTKMHGAGNDYVYVNAFQEKLPASVTDLAIAVSDRHKGIGADGLILICPSEVADARMRMFNADGSESEMCGNGVRCVAKYVYDHGIAKKPQLKIETGRGVLTLYLNVKDDKVDTVRVNMGQPILTAENIPTKLPGNPPVLVPLTAGDKTFPVTVVSMGNPHCITYVETLDDEWVLKTGPLVERHEMFPRRVNAEFVQVISPVAVNLRVWERGSGETQACGTGACAVCVAGVLTGKTARQITAHLPGGDLFLEWSEATGEVFMTGPATEVFTGQWN